MARFIEDTDPLLAPILFEQIPLWLNDKGGNFKWCDSPGADRMRCFTHYQGESFPGQVSGRTALTNAYNEGYSAGYDKSGRGWRADIQEVQRRLSQGETTQTELRVNDLGYARGQQERPAPGTSIPRPVILGPGDVSDPTKLGQAKTSAPGFAVQLLTAAILTSPAWLTFLVARRQS